MEKQKGFSLMELMVVIAIMAVLATFSINNMVGWKSSRRLGTSSRELLSSLQSLRLTAIKENRDIRVLFSTGTGDSGTYRAFVDMDNSGDESSGDRVAVFGRMEPGVTLSSATNSLIVFSSRGNLDPAVATGTTITVRNNTDTRVISVNLTGHSRIN